MKSIALYCKCDHDYQDDVYGPNKRLHNPCAKVEGTYRCTVCGNVKDGRKREV